MTDIDKLIALLNASCEYKYGTSSSEYVSNTWNMKKLSGNSGCGGSSSRCHVCENNLKNALLIQMEKDDQFAKACDKCKHLCIEHVTDEDRGKILFHNDKYVAEKMSYFRYCPNCKINMTIRNAKLKLKQPNVNMADVLSDCLDIFKQLSNQINKKID